MCEISQGGYYLDKNRVGSGLDRDRGLPDFLTNLGQVGMPYPEFSSIFPSLFRSEKIWEKSREIRKN